MAVIVTKFGGSSLADAAQFRKVAEIIKADPNRRFVVPSAPGKRFSEDTKVTDMLYACYAKARHGEEFEEDFAAIADRFDSIIRDLDLDLNLDAEYERMRSAFCNKAGRAYAASRGEYLNGIILARFLGWTFIDAAKVIFFDEEGAFDAEKTDLELSAQLCGHDYAVIPGFYGSTPDDTIKTFSRGGSDITGSIAARAARADVYENWTDVSGFLAADPRIVENPRSIQTITYRELRELSYMGATVLHEDAIFPVRASGIPINIRNTNAVGDPGTMIVSAAQGDCPTVTGIAGKKGFSAIVIEKAMMNSEYGFIRKTLEVLERLQISVEHMPSGIDTLSIIVATADLAGREDLVLEEVKQAVTADSVSLSHTLAQIAVVGRGMINTRGIAAKVFDAVAKAGINIRMIDQGSSELNIILGVDEKDFENAIRAIYQTNFD